MSEAVSGSESEYSEHVNMKLQDLDMFLQRDLAERLKLQEQREEAERVFFIDIIREKPELWASIFLGGKSLREFCLKDAKTLFTEVRKLFRDCILSGCSHFLSVSENQVGMPLSELAATDTAVKAGWMQITDKNPDARAGYITTTEPDGTPRQAWKTDSHPLARTQEGVRLLEKWTACFEEPSGHQFFRELVNRVQADAAQAVEQTAE
jgi:hypothetical protein